VTRRIAVLVNPTSGKGRGARLMQPVSDLLREGGLEPDVVVGRDGDEAFDRLRDRVAAGVDGVVALGGDGLVNIALQVVGGTEVPLGIVPAGTGNDIARSLGLVPQDAPAAVRLVLAGRTRLIDLGRANGRWFGGVLGSGFDSMVNERANRMSWPSGRSRYNLAILAELRTFRPVPYVLELDGRRIETEAMLVAVGNGPSYGGGMRVTPDAVFDDGLLDVLLLRRISTPEFLRVFPKVFRGAHTSHPAVEVLRARTVRLEATGIVSYADGERFVPLPMTMEVVPGALTVLA